MTTAWETETGLPNDVDGWIANPRFGYKEEYAQKVQAAGGEGLMFIVDLLDENGELVGSQGYSIGTGWIPSEDGLEITHPKRKNVVGNSLYGQLQNRVTKELGVKMDGYGLPTQAKSWDGLGFHWMLEPHDTVGGGPASGIMPTVFLGKKAGIPRPATPSAVPTPATGAEAKLAGMVKILDTKAFQAAALQMADVVNNDVLMAQVLDDGPTGFYATHKS